MTSPDFELSLTTNRATYRPGDTVSVRLTVRNRSDRPITIGFSSGQRYDFVVENEQGRTLYQWSAGRGFIQMQGEEKVPPGGRLVYRDRVAAPEVPGSYRLTGMLASASHPLAASVPFAVALKPTR